MSTTSQFSSSSSSSNDSAFLRRLGGTALALLGGTALALAAPAAAFADVSASSDATAPGGSAVVTFSAQHGCDGSATRVVTIDIPEEVPVVAPTVKAGWSVEKVMVPLDEPVESEDGTLTERVGQVVYTATDAPLEDGFRGTWELSVMLPLGEPGDVVAFPTTQTCEVGTLVWDGEKAPSVTLSDDVAVDGHGDAAEPAVAVGDGDGDGDGDIVARILGVLGLVAGAAALALALVRRRGAAS